MTDATPAPDDRPTPTSAVERPAGVPIGILMLDTSFPRPPGDIGHPATFPFPVLYHVVRHASPARVVGGADTDLIDGFVAGARQLEARGARAITTSCGFLVRHQATLAASVGVPVLTSSLLQYPLVRALLPPDRRVGILTFSRPSLTDAHLAAAGIPPGEAIVHGLEGCPAFHGPIIRDEPAMDQAAARAEVVAAARDLVATHPEVGALLLECTNLGPFHADLERATARPVFDIVGAVHWLHAALAPPRCQPGQGREF